MVFVVTIRRLVWGGSDVRNRILDQGQFELRGIYSESVHKF